MSVLDLVKNFKAIIKGSNLVEKPTIDDAIFRLHYRTTMLIFYGCSVFVTAYTFFGEPIQCMGDTSDRGKTKVANTYCYLGYTFTLPKYQDADGKLAGIGPEYDEQEEEGKKYHNYYRWVPLMLFLQGSLFYVTHWMWKNWENKKIKHLTANLRGRIMEVKSRDVDKLKILAKYAADSLHTHDRYASMYFFCEVLNFINVIVNMYLMNAFLGGEFMTYGIEVLQFINMPPEDRTDPMMEVFPRVTKCNFHKYGPSGTIQTHDYLCVLALNNVNEKIYIFLWFWLILLACVSILPILCGAAVYLSPFARETILKRYCILEGKSKIEKLAQKTRIGDFLILDLLGKNICSKYYFEFISELQALLIGNDSSEKLPGKLS